MPMKASGNAGGPSNGNTDAYEADPSPSSPVIGRPGVLARLRNALTGSTSSSGRDRALTADLSSSTARRSKAHVQAAKLANLRAYANGNVSSVDLSHLPPLPASAQSSLSSSSAGYASRSGSAGSDVLLASPQDHFGAGKGSPMSSSPSQRSPLSMSVSPSGAKHLQSSPEVSRAPFAPASSASGVQVPARTHRKATKSTATLPGWLSTPFAFKYSKQAMDEPATPTNPTALEPAYRDAELDITPKQKKQRTKNEDSLNAISNESLLQTSRKAFSRSVDDLSMMAKDGFLSSPLARSRKSVDERRQRRESLKSPSTKPIFTEESQRDTMPGFIPADDPDKHYAQIKLPPSVSLPSGLSIGSTATLLAAIEGGSRRQAATRSSPTDKQRLEAPFSFPSRAAPAQTRPSLGSKRSSSANTVSTTKRKVEVPPAARESQVILLQGLLQRKTDYRSHGRARRQSRAFPFYASASSSARSPKSPSLDETYEHVDLTKGWKPFFAILRGASLYLYKIPASHTDETRALFRTSWDAASTDALSGKIGQSLGASPVLVYSIPLAHSQIKRLELSKCADAFEVKTEEGELVLLQATSDADRGKWIEQLQEVARRVEDKRASYTAADEEVLATALLSITSGGRRDRLQSRPQQCFGVPLEALLAREGTEVPTVLTTLLSAVEQHGLVETGLYRVSGENKVVQAMKCALDGGSEIDISSESAYSYPPNLTSCVKQWLRELPEVVPSTFYFRLLSANDSQGYEERLYAIRDVIWQLPQPFFDLLACLAKHLFLVCEHELDNQMNASNLAVVFAPTIFRPPKSANSEALLMSNLGKTLKLLATIIAQQHWIFSYEEEEEAAEISSKVTSTTDDGDDEDEQGEEEETFHEAHTSVYQQVAEALP